MRTTIDLPDSVFRETKALAAMRGVSMKQFILEAIEQARNAPPAKAKAAVRPAFRPVRLPSKRKLSLDSFDFDDLLA